MCSISLKLTLYSNLSICYFLSMELYQNNFYHIYNRSNNKEKIFKESKNQFYFLEKYKHFFSEHLDTITYCLMPTHFHLLVKIISDDIHTIRKNFGIFLSAYTKAINNSYDRHGSLFQSHTKSKQIDQSSDLIKVISYIHQNPVRAGLISNLEDWNFSSYKEIVGLSEGNLCNRKFVIDLFGSEEKFIISSNSMLDEIDEKYWI